MSHLLQPASVPSDDGARREAANPALLRDGVLSGGAEPGSAILASAAVRDASARADAALASCEAAVGAMSEQTDALKK